MPPLLLPAQVDVIPTPTGDAWPWVAGVLAALLVWFIKEGLRRTDREITEWRDQAKTCTTDFGKTSDALRIANDTLEKSTEAQARDLSRNYDKLVAMDAKLDHLLGGREGRRWS